MRISRQEKARWAVALAVFCLAAPLGGGNPRARRVQLWVYWGGGAERQWSGRIGLPPSASEVALIWLADFEEDDLVGVSDDLTLPKGRVPTVCGGAESLNLAEASRPSVAVRSSTAGEADGVVFEVVAPLESRLAIDLDGREVSWSLGELLAEGRVLDLGEGNRVVVGGHDLEQAWPEVEGWQRVSLHTHSNFSTNPKPLRFLDPGLEPWVDRVWWTDHDALGERRLIGGEFENPEDLDGLVLFTSRQAVAGTEVDPDAFRGQGALRLDVRRADGGSELLWAAVRDAVGSIAGLHQSARPRLRWAWKAPPASSGAAYVEVVWGSGTRLRYQSATIPSAERPTLVIDAAPGEWQVVERDLAADRAAFGEGRGVPTDAIDDSISRLRLGVLATGDEATASFDAIEVGPQVADRIGRRESRLAQGSLPAHFGSEDSLERTPERLQPRSPHLTLLLPGSLRALESLAGAWPGQTPPRPDLVRAVHSAGGAVGAHHLQRDVMYEEFLEGRGWGADLFEISAAWMTVPAYSTEAERRARQACDYPPLVEDELFPLLVRWDRTTARGLLLTGSGAPDLNDRVDRATSGFFNRWYTWIEAERARPERLLAALRSGRAVGVEWRSRARLTMHTSRGAPMGKLVATDRPEVTVEARVEGALPGSTVRWIAGTFVASSEEDPAAARRVGSERLEMGSGAASIDLQVGEQGAFVRAEILDPTGHLVAFGNPIYAVPFWPRSWPYGRVAFDWAGLGLLDEEGVVLSDAMLEAGALRLAGAAGGKGGRLRLASTETPVARVDVTRGRARASLDEGRQAVLLEIEAGETFEAIVSLDEPLPEPERRALVAVPRRKEVFARLEAGEGSVDSKDAGSNFVPSRGGGLGALRRISEREVEVEIEVPCSEPYWLEIVVEAGRHATGTVLADGREIGRFGAYDSLVYAVEEAAGEAACGGTSESRNGESRSMRQRFSVRLDQVPDEPCENLGIEAVVVYGGRGVVDY